MIRIFAIDIDGTLLNTSSLIDLKTIEALKDLEETGVRVVLNSGRVFSSVLYYARMISNNPIVIANNGAVLGTDFDNIIKSYPMDDIILQKLVNIAKENDLDYHFYDLDSYYSDHFNEKKLKHLLKDKRVKDDYSVNLAISDDPIGDFKKKNKMAYKFQINGLNNLADSDKNIENIFKKEFVNLLYFTSSISGVLEMMVKGVSKFETLLYLTDLTGLARENIAAIGDGMNDLEMLKGARLSFAMGNGHDRIKDIADFTVADNDKGGVIEACEKIKEHNRCLI